MKRGSMPIPAMRTARSNRLISATRTSQATGEVQKSGVKMEPTRQPSSEWTMPIIPFAACIESSSKFS